jgi:2-oxoglutarate dehydrogenase E2 component (dihydrolipoamide succinyltransferase)
MAHAAQGPAPAPSASAPKAAQADAGVRTAALASHADALSAGRSSPAVRRLLAEHGLEGAPIRGTGAGGRITVDDVLAHVAQRTANASDPTVEDEAGVAVRRAPHTSVRKRIAARMVESLLHTAPHVTTVFEADMSAVLAHRARHRASFEERGASLTLTSYFLAACVDAILEVPEANSRWTAEALLLHESVDIGVGTAIEGKGLVVPVVRNVQSLDLFEISRELGELVRRAREDKLTPADVRGGTFTISNHGVSGSLVAAPIIINQPQSAILGVGKLEKRAVVVSGNGEDRIVVQPRCYVTLTLDHRVMDGQRANRFLEVLVRRLETWSD